MLFDSFKLAGLPLQNRMVMAPMTRSRSVENNAPNALVAEYYAQRASAGLIVTGSATRASPACTRRSRSLAGGSSPTPFTRRAARSSRSSCTPVASVTR
jgi:2,4-dienoyl-CoA reductase-like NADH-dependent reductase (Old Yellow Enzyme family)